MAFLLEYLNSAGLGLVATGFLASLVAGLWTGVGALGVFAFRTLSPRWEGGMLSFAAGIMLAASFFSLLLPSIEYGERFYESRDLAVLAAILG